MKLVREISELAMLKRARVERMKALKKMRAHKASSSTSNLFAMIITILFIFVIIYQGMFSKSNPSVSLHGSPESAFVAKGGMIQVEYFKSPSASETNGPGSRFPNDIEQVSGAGLEEEIHGVAG
ncbi:hypothetical protein L1049_020960 [Liquidambar formosana]|uniref:Transmembrane protein n=1 Tax=Liquidambar formosana TaxID=63359 RepID=A0AAP0SAQ8_LIQFO